MGSAALSNLAMIALLLLNEWQDFQREQAAAARDAAAREGAQIEVAYSDNSPITQIHQILEYLRRPTPSIPTAIVAELAGAAEAFVSVARTALGKGVGWVGLSGGAPTLQALREEFPGKLAVSITTDEEAIGRIHAVQCRAHLPTGGTILYVEGPGLQHEVRARRRGFEEGLQGSVIAIGKTLAADWTEDGAERTASVWLASPSGQRFLPALVCSQNDSMAVGVRRAAQATGVRWAGCPFIGCDGLPNQGKQLVEEGMLAATITKPVTAGMGVQCAIRAAAGLFSSQDLVLAPHPYPGADAPGHANLEDHYSPSSSASTFPHPMPRPPSRAASRG